MNSNAAVINETEREDIIFDYPDVYIPDEQNEKVEDKQLKIVATEHDNKAESDQNRQNCQCHVAARQFSSC